MDSIIVVDATDILEIEIDIRPPCQHHWLLEPPTGPTSTGFCKKCGEIKQFPNSIESFYWEETESVSGPIRAEDIRSAIGLDTY